LHWIQKPKESNVADWEVGESNKKMANNNDLQVNQQVQFDALMAGIEELKELILGKAKADIEGQYLDSEEARKLLGVSPKTWQMWRDKRILPFTQWKRKIWVKRADINAFLESNKKMSVNKE